MYRRSSRLLDHERGGGTPKAAANQCSVIYDTLPVIFEKIVIDAVSFEKPKLVSLFCAFFTSQLFWWSRTHTRGCLASIISKIFFNNKNSQNEPCQCYGTS